MSRIETVLSYCQELLISSKGWNKRAPGVFAPYPCPKSEGILGRVL